MKCMYENNISEKLVNSLNEEITFKLSNRLEGNYIKIFESLKDWNLLTSFAINNPKSTFDHIHLLDQEYLYEQ